MTPDKVATHRVRTSGAAPGAQKAPQATTFSAGLPVRHLTAQPIANGIKAKHNSPSRPGCSHIGPTVCELEPPWLRHYPAAISTCGGQVKLGRCVP